MAGVILGIIARRLMVAIPMMLVVSVMIFVVLRMLPADPLAMSLPPNATQEEAEAMRRELGLDRPIMEQYAIWLGHLVEGDLGRSIAFRQSVLDLIATTLPATIELVFLGLLLGISVGVAGGLFMFHVRGTRKEPAADLVSTILMSIPEFLWAIFLILGLGVALDLLPFIGRISPEFKVERHTGFLLLDTLLSGQFDAFVNVLMHMILPTMALALALSPLVMRVLRSSLLETILEDYVTMARLRGLSERRILLRHALKNAALPTLSLIGVQAGFLFGGTLLVEVIYSYPGLGNMMVEAVRNQDLPIIQGVALTYCLVVLFLNAMVDIAYLVLNPRLRPQ
ncbi:MAG TPA: ABC transporter permease [Alphaproteobacteria bacterium]|jgi:peptide/nickel transport system permease protein